jgi:hypothetical protein
MYAPAVTPKHITESNLENTNRKKRITSLMSKDTYYVEYNRMSYPKKSSMSAT